MITQEREIVKKLHDLNKSLRIWNGAVDCVSTTKCNSRHGHFTRHRWDTARLCARCGKRRNAAAGDSMFVPRATEQKFTFSFDALGLDRPRTLKDLNQDEVEFVGAE